MSNLILISGVPRSGNTLLNRIVQELTRSKFIETAMTERMSNSGILSGSLCTDKQLMGTYITEKEIAHMLTSINNEKKIENLKKIILKEENLEFFRALNSNILIATHSLSSDISLNLELKKYKKIYIVRDGRDVIHSTMKWVRSEEASIKLLSLSKTHTNYTIFNYLNHFEQKVNYWKEHVDNFLNYKEDFLLVRYEDLVLNTIEEIKKIAKYLEIEISNEKVLSIKNKFLNKELTSSKVRHKDAFHFSNGKKRGEWIEFYNEEMYEFFKETTKKQMLMLGYEVQKFSKLKQNHNSNEMIKKNFKSLISQKQEIANSFVDYLQIIMRHKRVVIIGYGEYTKKILKLLNNQIKSNIVAIVDDNYHNNIDIRLESFDYLVKSCLDYDLVLISLNILNEQKVRKKYNVLLEHAYSIYNSFLDEAL